MWTRIRLVIFIALAIQGCASGNKTSKGSTDALSEIKAALAADSSANTGMTEGSQPPSEITDALIPQYQSRIQAPARQEPVEERFDVTVNHMNARTFFMSLVRGTPINLVVHPDVAGSISLDLKSVTIDEVLEVTRDVYGYEYQRNRAGYLILPARLQSKIFNLSYLNVARKGESNTRVTSGQLATGEQDQGQNDNGNSSNQRGRSGRGGSTQAFASSKIATESNANFWNDLEATVRTLVGESEGRSVIVSPQPGLVVVRAMPGELRDVEAFLNNAQKNLQRQVIIEAKVIEVRLDDSFQAGINWVKLNQSAAQEAAGEGDFASQFRLSGGRSELFDEAGNLSLAGLANSRDSVGLANIFSLGTVRNDFAAIIRLLDQQGDVNVLSSPRVSTVNNQKAVIKVGSDEFFVTEISSTTTIGTSTSTTPEIILTPFFSGIALDVTPQINDQSGVILHIHPTISEVVDQIKDITVAGENQSLPLAYSTVRESDSIVRAKSGQVIIIGGLMQNQLSNTEGGIPGLKSIPVLGNLFKQKQRRAVRSELVILLKPTVIGDDGEYWKSELEQVSNRVDQLSR
ncbi:MAG: pilus (MSHA type) biogenesis protein MshL [Gammaproteobacteria bacterium]|nr:pilus (MSHA type) biogenesis protein MshL [Gammaproteobacteria bacterium]